jgi:hypothetical protein
MPENSISWAGAARMEPAGSASGGAPAPAWITPHRRACSRSRPCPLALRRRAITQRPRSAQRCTPHYAAALSNTPSSRSITDQTRWRHRAFHPRLVGRCRGEVWEAMDGGEKCRQNGLPGLVSPPPSREIPRDLRPERLPAPLALQSPVCTGLCRICSLRISAGPAR